MSAEREADINVETDLNGLVGFKVGRGTDGRVYLTEAGELAINFTSDEGGDGVNINSRCQVRNIRNEGQPSSRCGCVIQFVVLPQPSVFLHKLG